MQKVTTFLMFNKGCQEAMEFYASIIPNCRIVSKKLGPGGGGGTFEIDGQKFSCYDGGDHFNCTPGMSLMISADNQEEVDLLYDGLSEGGTKEPCGWVTDKWGVSWQITPPQLLKLISDPDPAKAKRVADAMLKMHKIIIADLEAAAAAE